MTTALIAASGHVGEVFEDVLSGLPGITYEVFEESNDLGVYTEATLDLPDLGIDEASDFIYDAFPREIALMGEWWEG